MILVDSSVWIDHFRVPIQRLFDELSAGNVLIHPLVIGELACGPLADRIARLRQLRSLLLMEEHPHDEVIAFVEANALVNRGLGFVDVHLLFSTVRHEGASLWTRDSRLRHASELCGVAFVE